MERFIWYSAPGVILLPGALVLWPDAWEFDVRSIVAGVILASFLGFIIQQIFRFMFEATGSFARPSRSVLNHICGDFAQANDLGEIDRQTAFLIWEITFYSNAFPDSFRDHDRGAWHYIFSFWSITLAALITLGLCMVAIIMGKIGCDIFIGIFSAGAAIGVLFYLKGRQTYLSLIKQEEAVFKRNEKAFRKTAKRLLSGDQPDLHSQI